MREAIETAEPIKAELDRGLRILLPNQASKRVELPSAFFNISAEEIKKEQQARYSIMFFLFENLFDIQIQTKIIF